MTLSNGLLANAKEHIAEKKTSTTSTSSLPSVRRTSRTTKYGTKNVEGDDEDDDDYEIRGLGGETLAGFSSLEKYRPCNYDLGAAPKEMDDINDIRDYYANLNTRSRAMQRVVSSGIEPTYGSNDYGNYSSFGSGRRRSTQMTGNRRLPMKYDDEEEFGSRKSSNQSGHQPDFGDQESLGQPEEPQMSQMPTQVGMQPQQPSYPTYNSSGYAGGYEPDFFDRLNYGTSQQQQLQQQPSQQGPYGYTQPSYNNYQGVGGNSMAGYQVGGYPPQNPYNNNVGQNSGRYNNTGYNIAEMDPTTQLILSRARDVYNTTNYHMEDYNKQKDTERRVGGHNSRPPYGGRGDDLSHLRPSPPKQQSEEGSMMNSRTRSLLENLKKTTNALSDMTAEEETTFRPLGGKPPGRQSRFLRKQESSEPIGKDYSPPRGVASLRQMEAQKSPINDDYVSRLADDVLGESIYPPLDDNRRSNDSRRPTYESSFSTLPSRKSSAPYERNLSPPSFRDNLHTRNNHDDEDIDAYINNLKQKTSGRDMVKVVSEIEGRRVTPPRMSRDRDEGPSNDYGGSRQRRESGRGGTNDYSYNNERGNDFSSYNNNASSFARGRQENDRQPTKFTLGNRRDMSTDRSARNRSTSISRRGSFQADSSDFGQTMTSRNRYGKEEANGMGPFGGTAGPQISSRKQPYLRSYSNSNYASND